MDAGTFSTHRIRLNPERRNVKFIRRIYGPRCHQGYRDDIDEYGVPLQEEQEPVTPNLMRDRNTGVPNEDEESPVEETKDNITQEVEMQERQAKSQQQTLELMARQMNVNKEAKRLQSQQAAMVMDHLCDNLLDLGSYDAAEHPFTVWLKAKNMKSILVLFMISHETMIADGYDPPTHLW